MGCIRGGGPPPYFDGAIDDVRVYNRALSTTEIRQLMGIRYVKNTGSDANDGLSWSTPKLTIQAAINSANPGDDVWVLAGSYVEGLVIDRPLRLMGIEAETDTFDDLIGRTATTPAMVFGTGYLHTIHINADAVIDGLYVSGGNANGTGEYENIGGGIFAENGSSVIRNCTIANNTAANWGGGMTLFGVQQVSDCTITVNQITNVTGGGHGVSVHGDSIFSNVIFTSNGTTTVVGYGGGVYVSSSTPTFTQCTFYANAADDGAGIYVSDGGTVPVFDRCTIWDNDASNNGGGLYIKNSAPIFKKSFFMENTAGNHGGGVYAGTSSSSYYSPLFENCVFGLNMATYSGGGLYIDNRFSPDIINCNIMGNSAGSLGGGLYLYPTNAFPTVFNSIVWGNTATGDAQYSFTPDPSEEQNLRVAYSNFEGGIDNTAPYREGNISQDPNFIDADGPDDNLYTWQDNNIGLADGSPCIDTGAASFPYAGVTAATDDLYGTVRPRNAGYDMGAFEYNPGNAYLFTNSPGGFGDPNNYSTYRMIVIPAGVGAGLYAGIWGDNGAKIYKYDSGSETWNDITPTAEPDWSVDNAGVNSLYTVGGYLFAGTYNGVTGTQIWRYGGSWDYWTIDGFGLGSSAYSADSMALYSGYTYAAAAKGSGVGIMRFDGGTDWTQVNIDDGFYSASGNYRAHAMIEYNGVLFVGTENGSGAQLWTYDEAYWLQETIPGFSTNNTVIRSMAVYNGNLYLATNNTTSGLEVWKYDGSSWTQVNANGFGNTNNVQAKSMVVHNGALYVGTDNSIDGGEVWKFNGSNWSPYLLGGVGGDTLNEYVNSLASFEGDLFVGTYNITDGTEIWATSDSLSTYTLTYDASVMHLVGSDGSSNTLLGVTNIDFSGTLPDDIDSISVERDGADMGLTINDFSFNTQFNQFYAVIPGPPVAGSTYTFTITAGATSVSNADTQGTIHYLPSPGGASLYPFDGLTVYRSTPTFSWQPLYYPSTTLYYRLEVALDDLGAPGDRVFATDRTTEMYHHTLPPGTLNPGQTYWWRLRVTDADTFVGAHNRRNTSWQQFTMAFSVPGFSKAPGIIDDTVGVSTFNLGTQVYLYFRAKVVDHEGIPVGGTSHQVKVAFPAGSPAAGGELMLYFEGGENYDGSLLGGLGGYRIGYYETFLVSLQGTDPALWAGDYIFTVTDADDNSASFTDTLTVAVIDQPAESSVTVNGNNNLGESITATFDNVLVDGSPYDDFSGYATIDDVIASPNWLGYGGDGTVSIVSEQVQITSPAKVGRSHTHLTFDPLAHDFVHSVQADVTVTAATSNGAPRARIWDVIYNNGTNDVYVVVNIHSDRVTYHVNERIMSGNTAGWNCDDISSAFR
ncbi:choice-of-anchor Q domain-containing protein [Thermodesulfobacteriota bacterium]